MEILVDKILSVENERSLRKRIMGLALDPLIEKIPLKGHPKQTIVNCMKMDLDSVLVL